MHNSLHYQRLTGEAKGSLYITETRNIRKLTPCCLDSNSMIVLLLRSIRGLWDVLLSIYGSLYYGLVCLTIPLK